MVGQFLVADDRLGGERLRVTMSALEHSQAGHIGQYQTDGHLVAGCANYHLGTGGTPTFRTLYIEPVANKTLLAQSQPLVSTRLR